MNCYSNSWILERLTSLNSGGLNAVEVSIIWNPREGSGSIFGTAKLVNRSRKMIYDLPRNVGKHDGRKKRETPESDNRLSGAYDFKKGAAFDRGDCNRSVSKY